MTLPRLLLAMAIRSLAIHLEQRLDPLMSTIVGAIGFVSEGRWDVDGLLEVPVAVGEVGARVSGVVAGCGCKTSDALVCGTEYPGPPCLCQCHEAVGRVRMAVHRVGLVMYDVQRVREALAARPSPEVDDIDDDDDWQDYGVTAPGGST